MRLYPVLAVVLFLVHFEILNYLAGGIFDLKKRVVIRVAGVCIVLACTFAGNLILRKWMVERSVADRCIFDPTLTSDQSVWAWWERRRAHYNTILLFVGIVSGLLMLTAGEKAHVFFLESGMSLILGPLLYGLVANLCYTFGATWDWATRARMPSLWLFRLGLFFSIALTALPGFVSLVAWLIFLATGHRLADRSVEP